MVHGAGIRDERVLKAVARVPRVEFVPPEAAAGAYFDEPIPIGRGQVTTQPSLVARMVEALSLRGGEHVLEIGTGLGWQTACWRPWRSGCGASSASPTSRRRPAGTSRGAIVNAEVVVGDGGQGLAEHAPYDAIVVSAASPEVPSPLTEQLADRGRLVHPLGTGGDEQVTLFEKRSGEVRARRTLTGARFVKLVSLEGDQALLGELADGVGGALAGVAGLLDPAVGHLVGAEGGHLVDEDAAELEPVAGLEGEAESRVKTPAWRPKRESLASSIASSKEAKLWTVATGPKISSHQTLESREGSRITVGARHRSSSTSSPPVRISPVFAASSTHSFTRSRSLRLISGPTSVFSSIGSPVTSCSTFLTKRSVNLSATSGERGSAGPRCSSGPHARRRGASPCRRRSPSRRPRGRSAAQSEPSSRLTFLRGAFERIPCRPAATR